MLYLEISNLKKYFGDKLVFDIENLKIYSEDKVGIIGVNGAGKSTLLNIISGKVKAEEGFIKVYEKYSYIYQLAEDELDSIENLSGGEKTKLKIEKAFHKKSSILMADEPTSNLDISSVKKLENMLLGFKGAVLLVSHDRGLLDTVCNKIIEIENGKLTLYKGNYTEFLRQKNIEMQRKEFEYNNYIKEKSRLEGAIHDTYGKMQSVNKAPRRMGNSEARLHKMGDQRAKANLDKKRKAIEARMKHLEIKEKPFKNEKTKIDFAYSEKIHSKIIIKGNNINKRFGKKVIFEGAEFNILNGSKTALIGNNGCGKTTLIRMIMNDEKGIAVSRKAQIGYFSQELDVLSKDKTILENVMEDSIYDEKFVRHTLARLLFKREDVYKKVYNLSGGERVKVSFAKIILGKSNILVLDEPTNYLDVYSMEALESVLKEYRGTLLFVSHDRKFISNIADCIISINNHKISEYNCNYSEYMDLMNGKDKNRNIEDTKIVLKNRLSEIIGRLSMPSRDDEIGKLDMEYKIILKKLKEIE
ncbi:MULTISPECIES: ribosomal protection-like ABC-F family protein [Clostridium]|uniref:ribosomal protection-like ABC-F family protein n=1 Tax=Clostridium TaxID=1485 RepID=UPI0008241AE1|nr:MULTISPECIES: ABC-F family ATP-binding cassette domain-containing protein [Clostridium]PJI09002.1 ABC transporter ATP-binding protein [Clostridium sp. CT7]